MQFNVFVMSVINIPPTLNRTNTVRVSLTIDCLPQCFVESTTDNCVMRKEIPLEREARAFVRVMGA